VKKSGASGNLGKSGSNPDLEKKASGALGSTKAKGYYNCILKWRAEEFRGTEIMDAHICQGAKPEDCTMVISTKDKQIIYLNLYS